MIDVLSPEEITDIVHVDLVCWRVDGANKMKCPFTHTDNWDSSEKCLWSASTALLCFFLLFIKKVVFWYVWKSTIQAPDCSSFRILDSWNGICFRARAWIKVKGRHQAHCWQQTSKILFSAGYLRMENKFSNSLLLFINLNMSQLCHAVASRKEEGWSVWDGTWSVGWCGSALSAVGKAGAEQHVHFWHWISKKVQATGNPDDSSKNNQELENTTSEGKSPGKGFLNELF